MPRHQMRSQDRRLGIGMAMAKRRWGEQEGQLRENIPKDQKKKENFDKLSSFPTKHSTG